MKILKMLSILALGAIAISASAQGTWKTTETIPSVAVSTETGFGITGLTCMHSDITGVLGKVDAGVSVTYNGVTYDNAGIFQGGTNGMYFALRPTADGTIDVCGKMGANKPFFVCELTAACPNEADLAALTAAYALGSDIYITPANVTFPQVYDTYHASTSTWDGTVNFHTVAGVNQYAVMSFPVLANKTYIFGVNGSKFMLRGVNYTLGTSKLAQASSQAIGVSPNPAKGSVNVNVKEATEIAIYNSLGSVVKQQLVAPADNTVDISGLAAGVYFVKDVNSTTTSTLIVK